LLYSIIFEYTDTFVVQCIASSEFDAQRQGIDMCVQGQVPVFNESQSSELADVYSKRNPPLTSISALKNVWVNTFLVEDELVQIHVIATNEGVEV